MRRRPRRSDLSALRSAPSSRINALATVFMTGAALAAAVTDSSSLSSVRLWTICGLLFLLLAAATRARVHVKRHFLSLIAGLSVAVVTVINLLRWTDASLYPTSGSGDVTWHYAVLQNLFYNGQVPSGMDHPAVTFLHEMAIFPFGGHVERRCRRRGLECAAVGGDEPLRVFDNRVVGDGGVRIGTPAIRETWPRSSEGAAVSAAVTAALAFLAMTRFTEGMVLADYFFAQVVGIYLLLVGALGFQDYFSRGSRVGLGTSAIASVLLVLTYPQYCLIPIGTVALLVLVRHRWQWRKWGAIVPVAAGTILGLLIFLPWEDLVVDEDFRRLRGSCGKLLACQRRRSVGRCSLCSWIGRGGIGVGSKTRGRNRRTRGDRPCGDASLASMLLLKRTIEIGSSYMAGKLVHVVSWLALPLVGVGAFAIASAVLKKRLLRTRKAGTFMALGLVAAVVAWAVLLVPEEEALPVVDPDGYVVADAREPRSMHRDSSAWPRGAPEAFCCI